MKIRKKLLALALVLTLFVSVFSLPFTASAAPSNTGQADTLKALGLFLGTPTGYQLERSATRAEAAVMVVRLLGMETVAEEEDCDHPFTDVPTWADCYIGYLYENGITKGVSATLYGSFRQVTPNQYATFMLRSLGYQDGDDVADFKWDAALSAMAGFGILSQSEAAAIGKPATLTRDNLVAVSRATLLACQKDSVYPLLHALYFDNGAISPQQMKNAARLDARVAQIAAMYGIPCPSNTTKVLDSEQIFAKCSSAVFIIEGEDDYDLYSGSGFFISSDGVAVTNYHVLEDLIKAEIKTADGKHYAISQILGYDYFNDVALIKIEGKNFPYLKLADPKTLRTGQRIYCIGSPLGFENTISDGLVSSPVRAYPQIDDRELIQISAPISHGSSGGAVLNEYGDVVGISSMGSDWGQNLNFAIPITTLGEISRFFDPPKTLAVLARESYWDWSDYWYDEAIEEEEPNDDAPAQTLESYTEYNGTLSDIDDVDLYRITAARASEVYLVFRTTEEAIDSIQFDIINLTTGQTVLTSRRVEDIPYLYLDEHLSSGVQYALRIRPSEDADESLEDVPYEFIVYLEDSPTGTTSPWEYWVEEVEPNDTPETSNYFIYGGMTDTYLLKNDDVDWFHFYVDSSTTVSFLFANYYDYDTMKAEIYNADNMQLITTLNAGYSLLESAAFTKYLAAGKYYIKVYGVGLNVDEDDYYPNYMLYVGTLNPNWKNEW